MQSSAVESTRGSTHIVQFYEGEDHLFTTVAAFLADGIRADEPCLIIAMPEHVAGFAARLNTMGHALAELQALGRVTLLDARATLGRFMVGGMPDRQRFRAVLGALLQQQAGGPHRKVRAYGEMVDVLWRDGNPAAAVYLEELWEELAQEHTFALLCAYALNNFYKEVHGPYFQRICQHHTHVRPAETVGATARWEEVALLQQRAKALETEIEHRRELEHALRRALSAQRATERELRESQESLRDFVDNALEGMHWVGPDGTILWANQAELDLLGYAADEYIDHNIVDFHEDREAAEAMLRELHSGRSVRNREMRMLGRAGIKVVLVNSNVLWRDGRFLHTRCFMSDITDRKRAEEALRRARDEAAEASRAKSDFLAVMSHELRTPLNAILGYHDLLEQGVGGPVTRDQRTYLSRIQSATQQLLRVIEQILSLTRTEAGKDEVYLSTVDLITVVRESAALLEVTADQKGVQLVVHAPARPMLAEVDVDKVRQILLNLLSNAVKFTDAGRVAVTMRSAGRSVFIEVADTGPGIASEDMQRIFEPFVQVDAGNTRRHGGTGLGLAVSRNLAHSMGGDLTAVSTWGAGSRFILELPTGTPVLELVPRRRMY
jgi:PAS domain S-box-containing protein